MGTYNIVQPIIYTSWYTHTDTQLESLRIIHIHGSVLRILSILSLWMNIVDLHLQSSIWLAESSPKRCMSEVIYPCFEWVIPVLELHKLIRNISLPNTHINIGSVWVLAKFAMDFNMKLHHVGWYYAISQQQVVLDKTSIWVILSYLLYYWVDYNK